MKRALLATALFSLPATAFALVPGNEDASPHRPFPSPRHSGTGRIEFTSSNVQLVSWLSLSDFPGGNTSASDCWGYTSPSGREYALIGLSAGTGFVEITDPGAPELLYFGSGASSLWHGLKVYQEYAYVVSEGGLGIQVFDMSQIDSGIVTHVGDFAGGSCTTATHTLAIDEVSGYLYRAGGGSSCGGVPQGLQIYSLANPESPALVASWNNKYVHECQVVTWDLPGPNFGKQFAFCYSQDTSGGTNPRLLILDVSNKNMITQVSSTSYAGGAFSHQGWLSADKMNLYLDDELDDGSFGASRTRIFNISNLAAPSYLGWFSSGAGSIDHNLYVDGNRIYEANYRSGLRVFDNTNPTAPTQIGFFDTYPEDNGADFNGLWSNFPYFPSGTVIGGDIEKGLFVWRMGAAKLTFAFPGGAPELLPPTGGSLQFEVTEDMPGDLIAGTVRFHYSTGGPFSSVNASHVSGDTYQASLPTFPCGSQVDYYVSARSTDGVTWSDPPAGETQVYIATAAFGEVVSHEDTMETDLGWLVGPGDTATTGIWTRVDPVGTSAQPEDDHTPSPGIRAWVTGQGAPGGGLGDNDVDNGMTTLRSPVFSAAGLNDPYISYWRWFSNNQNGSADDTFLIDISNNGGTSWVSLEVLGPTGPDSLGGWIRHRTRIADHVVPTSNMRLRFRAQDNAPGSIVEAAIDDLQVVDLECDPPNLSIATVLPASGDLDGGNIVTITGSGFVAGGTSVDFGANPAHAITVIGPTQMTVRVPPALGPRGGRRGWVDQLVDVRVTTSFGTVSLVDGYVYQLPVVR